VATDSQSIPCLGDFQVAVKSRPHCWHAKIFVEVEQVLIDEKMSFDLGDVSAIEPGVKSDLVNISRAPSDFLIKKIGRIIRHTEPRSGLVAANRGQSRRDF
jgi:hypothetical protein